MDIQPARPRRIETETWMLRLKAAYEAGYYRTEAAEGEQTRFPWQDRTCIDCPFWAHETCLVRESYRAAHAATCRYFDPWNYAEAESIIQYNKIPLTPAEQRQRDDDQAA